MYIWRTYVSSKLWILLSKEWKLKGNLQSVGNQVDPADIFSSSDIWLLGLDINISSVVEFQRSWVLKSKILAQESKCSKEILIPTTLNYLWSSVVSKNQSFQSWFSCSYTIFGAKFEISGTNWVEKNTHIYLFYLWFKNKRVWAEKIGKKWKNSIKPKSCRQLP